MGYMGRQTEIDRDRQRQTETGRDRQTQTDTDIHTHKYTHTHTQNIHTHTNIHTQRGARKVHPYPRGATCPSRCKALPEGETWGFLNALRTTHTNIHTHIHNY